MADDCEDMRTTMRHMPYISSLFACEHERWRMTATNEPPRLPDVKPPCSNLAGAYGSGHFLFCLSQPLRMPAERQTRRDHPRPRRSACKSAPDDATIRSTPMQ